MLDATLKTQLESYLSNLQSNVEIEKYSDDSTKSRELDALVDDIASLSQKVSVVQGTSSAERIPSMIVRSKKTGSEIRFAGVPMGHEFSSLVLALLHSGGHPIKLEMDLIEQIRQLKGEFNFEIFISLSCHNCPEVVQALNMMAAINPAIRSVMIDGAVFPEEAEQRKVLAVPSLYLNGKLLTQGRVSLKEILNKIDSGASQREAENISAKEPFEVLVLGGGPAGAAAAIYAARKGIRTGVVAQRFGGQVADTLAIENFISVKSTEGPKLVAGLEQHVRDYDVDIIQGVTVSNVEPASEIGAYARVTLSNGAVLYSRSVIVATGARWREMNVPGEKEYRGKGVAYCPHCDGPLFKGKRVAVIGGGNSGIEAAIDLAGIVEHVTVLEYADALRADQVLQDKANSLPNVEIITQAQTTEVVGNGERVNGLYYRDRVNGEQQLLSISGVFVQIGLLPNAEFLKETLELSDRGEIVVNARGETSQQGVFAAGDVTTQPFKQIIIAMGSGATAALGAFDYLIRTSNSIEEAQRVA